MKFIELKDAFTDNVIYVNVNSITILAPANCMVNGKNIEGCNVTYNIGSSVSSITIAKTCQEVIDTIINHDYLPKIEGKTIHISEKPDPELLSTLRQFYNRRAGYVFTEADRKNTYPEIRGGAVCTSNLVLKGELHDPEGYRVIRRGEKVFPGDKTINSEYAPLQKPTLQDVDSFLIGKSCPGNTVIYRRYMFERNEAVVLTNSLEYVPYLIRESMGISKDQRLYKLYNKDRLVKAIDLAPYIPPQEPPQCNGNGTAQKTEE